MAQLKAGSTVGGNTIVSQDWVETKLTAPGEIGGTTAGIVNATSIVVSGNVDGRDVSADGAKLDNIEENATADQTGSEIKSLYEAESNTNAYTDTEKSKLAGIAENATAIDLASPGEIGGTTPAAATFTTLTLSGPQSFAINTPDLSGNTYSIASSDYTVLIDDDDADVTDTIVVTLPAAASNTKRMLNIKKIGSSQTVQIDGNASETIDGATTYNLTSQYDCLTIHCDGTGWVII